MKWQGRRQSTNIIDLTNVRTMVVRYLTDEELLNELLGTEGSFATKDPNEIIIATNGDLQQGDISTGTISPAFAGALTTGSVMNVSLQQLKGVHLQVYFGQKTTLLEICKKLTFHGNKVEIESPSGDLQEFLNAAAKNIIG